MIKKIFIALIGFFLLIVFYFTYAVIINPKSPKGYANIVEKLVAMPPEQAKKELESWNNWEHINNFKAY